MLKRTHDSFQNSCHGGKLFKWTQKGSLLTRLPIYTLLSKTSLLISYRIYFACVGCKYSKCCKEEKALTCTDWNHLGFTLSRNGDPSVTVGTSEFLWFFLRHVQGCSDAPHVQCIFGWHTLNSISVVAIGNVFQITFFPHRKNHSLVFWLPY